MVDPLIPGGSLIILLNGLVPCWLKYEPFSELAAKHGSIPARPYMWPSMYVRASEHVYLLVTHVHAWVRGCVRRAHTHTCVCKCMHVELMYVTYAWHIGTASITLLVCSCTLYTLGIDDGSFMTAANHAKRDRPCGPCRSNTLERSDARQACRRLLQLHNRSHKMV